MKINYETVTLNTKRLIIQKGDSEICEKVYEYDLTKCTGIDGQDELVKFDKPIDFIGSDKEQYYTFCENEKMFDWYILLKDDYVPIGNIIADKENSIDESIEISYNCHPDYWGEGYIIEATKKIIDHLKIIGYKKIVIHFFEGNERSKRICEKLDFSFNVKTLDYFNPTDKMLFKYEYTLDIL